MEEITSTLTLIDIESEEAEEDFSVIPRMGELTTDELKKLDANANSLVKLLFGIH